MSITVKNISKRFNSFTALDNVSLNVRSGGLLALLGPSGSGKTTLLRVIAGLETVDEGVVFYQDEEVTHRSARERNVGFVFQHYALFRHMNVFENIAFALRVRRRKEEEIRARVAKLLRLVRLEGLEKRRPSQLSGGQRQRVALARALAAQPRVLLLDEPFGALDAKVRQELRQWLRQLHRQIHCTTVLVTHDQEEAFEVADRVVVMNRGRVEQVGSPREVFEHPTTPFVMDFLGRVNVFHGRVQNGWAFLGKAAVPCPDYLHGEERSTAIYVRPHELDIELAADSPASLAATVLHVHPLGAVVRIQLHLQDRNEFLNVELSPERFRELDLQIGDHVYVVPRRARVFVPDYAI